MDGNVAWERPDGGPILPPADVVVVLPLGSRAVVPFTVDAAPAKLDVHLNVDTTGSMGGEISNLADALESSVIPRIRALVPDTAFGVSRFEDFPVAPFGDVGDRPFRLEQSITTSTNAARNAVGRLADLGNGGDFPESGIESLYQIATGDGLVAPNGEIVIPRSLEAEGDGIGLRAESFRVVVHVTDAATHDGAEYAAFYPAAHTGTQALAALLDQDVHVVGIASSPAARPYLEDLARATGATMPSIGGSCPTGIDGAARPAAGGSCPLVFDVSSSGTGLSDSLVDAVTSLVEALVFDDVHGSVSEDRLGLVVGIEAQFADTPTGVNVPFTEDTTPGDGLDDTFRGVYSGTKLHFALHLANDRLASLGYEQAFRVRVRITAGRVVVVDQWIRIVVPA